MCYEEIPHSTFDFLYKEVIPMVCKTIFEEPRTTEQLLEKTDNVCAFIKECILSKRFDNSDIDAALDNVLTLVVNMDRDIDIQFGAGPVGFSYVEGSQYPNGVKRIISVKNVDITKL
jgi:hypothetical protein